MIRFTDRLRALVLALGLALAMPVAGQAACDDLLGLSLAQVNEAGAANPGDRVLAGLNPLQIVQSGLRGARGDDPWWLQDTRLGPLTRGALTQLCNDVPRSGAAPDTDGTLELTREYAELTALMPRWRGTLGSALAGAVLAQVADAPQSGGRITLPLRLAGTPRMTVPVLEERVDLFDCAEAEAALTGQATALQAARQLQRLYRYGTAAELCSQLPLAGSASDFAGAMARLGRLESALPGALAILASPGFANRIAENSAKYHLRLLGSETAVLLLIEEYLADRGQGSAQAQDRAPPLPGTIDACRLDRTESTLVYYALSQSDIDALSRKIELQPVLEQFRAENPGFGSHEALWQRLSATLGPLLRPCVLDAIRQIVEASPDLARSYSLNPQATDNLMLDAGLQPVMPVIRDFANSSSRSEDGLLDGIRAALTADRGKAMAAEVEEAAQIMAAAAEPEAVIYDIAPEDVEVPELPPAVPRVVVTGATDDALADTIGNEQFRKVLAETPFAPATSPELIRGQVRGALRGAAAVQAAETVDRLMTAIAPAITDTWSLTPELEALILNDPGIRQATDNSYTIYLQDWAKPLLGIEYPSLRLFEAALDAAPLAPGMDSTNVAYAPLKEWLTLQARKTVSRPEVRRSYGSLETEDCNCVPRRPENAQVYGFYPFWEDQFEPAPADSDAAAGTGETPPVPPRRRVDFGTVDRVAFYGLELARDPQPVPGEASLDLRQAGQWQEARRSFVNSAHRYRASADLAIDLWGWKDWSLDEIDSAAGIIRAQMQPFPRFGGSGWGPFKAALPTFFDPRAPDGVTLIFRDYASLAEDPVAACQIKRLVDRVHQSLPDRGRQVINLGLDIDLPTGSDADWERPVFDGLEALLRPSDDATLAADLRQCDLFPGASPEPVATAGGTGWAGFVWGLVTSVFRAADPEYKRVDKLLVFLQRPTGGGSGGAAQMLRYRMEVSGFHGETQTEALRSIIPVVPPGAHQFVGRQGDYSTFQNDVIYFQDNFDGIGFWPAPRPAGEDADRSEIANFLGANLNTGFSRWTDNRICRLVCPNRAYINFAAIALLIAVAGLTWRSFYSGLADRLAFRVLTIGLVWIGNLLLLAMLILLSICDPAAASSLTFLVLLITTLGLILLYNFIQRAKNGPMP